MPPFQNVTKVELIKNTPRIHLMQHLELRIGNVAKVQDSDTGFNANQLIGSMGAHNTNPKETFLADPPANGRYLVIQTVQDVALAVEEVNAFVNEV